MTFCYAYRLVPRPIVVSRASYIVHCGLRRHPQPRNKIINMKPIAVVDKVRLLLFRRFHSSKKKSAQLKYAVKWVYTPLPFINHIQTDDNITV